MKDKPDYLRFCVVLLGVLEAWTLAIWLNEPHRLASLIWALPLITGEALTGLFCLQMWYDERDKMRGNN